DLRLYRAEPLRRRAHAGAPVQDVRLLARSVVSPVSTARRRRCVHSPGPAEALPARSHRAARTSGQRDRRRNALGLHEPQSLLVAVSRPLRAHADRGDRAIAVAAQRASGTRPTRVLASARVSSLAPAALTRSFDA